MTLANTSPATPLISRHRGHPLWLAFMLHRLSGLGLALFLPAHFWLLSQALEAERMDVMLGWTANPFFTFAEFGLVFLLAVHFFGGLRLLALEFLPWSAGQKTLAAVSLAGAFLVAGAFLLNAL
ncbi:succinate dehydrogenase, cytochrome b556 subunit [Brevirhabdus sp.]|uniref:succinate dehydrogenase, cytochrome b556 subunit n=1 Tax=Brevirhabdus sp. TaxID=2004514 RepID=UPI00405954BB